MVLYYCLNMKIKSLIAALACALLLVVAVEVDAVQPIVSNASLENEDARSDGNPRSTYGGQAGAVATNSIGGQMEFGAYYTKVSTGQEWESYSRTGNNADIVVRLPAGGGEVVFWRGNSYLPF